MCFLSYCFCMSREDFEFQCPYCGETIWMEFYPEDGASQDTIVDCEVCCQPIHYQVQFRNGDAQVSVNRDH